MLVTFFSHQGLRADPRKVEAITNMPIALNTDDVHRFLGLVTCLGDVYQLCQVKPPNYEEKGNNWNWNQKHLDQFQNLEHCVTDSPTVQYFNPALPVKMLVHTSKTGLRAVLLQLHDDQWRPVAYASRVLN